METSFFEKAVKAYARYCERNGFIYAQPSELMSTDDRKFVYLENINGRLADYNISTGRISVPGKNKE